MKSKAHCVIRSTALAALLAVAAGFLPAGGASAAPDQQPTAEEIQNRLLGRDQAAPAADTPATPDCSTQEALETNPACFNQVSGSERGFSLISPATRQRPATATASTPAARPAGAATRPAVVATRAPAVRPRPGAAASCGLRDTSDDRGVNLCVTFGLNSAVLTPQSRSSLDRLAQALNGPAIQGHAVRIEGYADASGSADINQKLSEARANAVLAYLVSSGVSRDRLEAAGLGATHLLPNRAPTDPANRRVEARLRN